MNLSTIKAAFSSLPRPARVAIKIASLLTALALTVHFWAALKQAVIFVCLLVFLAGFASYHFVCLHLAPMAASLVALSTIGTVIGVLTQRRAGAVGSIGRLVVRQGIRATLICASCMLAAIIIWVFLHPAGLLPDIC